MKKQEASLPNYVTKIHQMWQTGALPRTAGYHQFTVWHDDDCGIFAGKRCDCDPDITLKFSLDGLEN
jgi:hypothetical protein